MIGHGGEVCFNLPDFDIGCKVSTMAGYRAKSARGASKRVVRLDCFGRMEPDGNLQPQSRTCHRGLEGSAGELLFTGLDNVSPGGAVLGKDVAGGYSGQAKDD